MGGGVRGESEIREEKKKELTQRAQSRAEFAEKKTPRGQSFRSSRLARVAMARVRERQKEEEKEEKKGRMGVCSDWSRLYVGTMARERGRQEK